MNRCNPSFLGRLGAAVTAAAALAASMMLSGPATAATVTLAGGTTSCTYSNVSGTATGDFTFYCTTTSPTSPGTLAFTSAGASLAPNGTTSVVVARSGGTSGAASASLSGCSVNPTTVSFADGSSTPTPASVTVTAPASGTCTVTLTPTGATAGSPTSFLVTVVDPNAPVTFTFSSGTSSATIAGSSVPITVTRSGGPNGDWSVPFALTGTLTTGGVLVAGGGTITPASPLTFPANSQSATITYTPPASAPAGFSGSGTIVYTLGTPVLTSTATGQTGSVTPTSANTMTVQGAAGGSCPTTATVIQQYVASNVPYGPIKAGETAAVAIPLIAERSGRIVKVTLAETASSDSGVDVQFTISPCPGDFLEPYPTCMQHTQYTGGSLNFTFGPKPAGTPWYMNVCELPVGTTTAYFNFRHIKRPTPVPSDGPGTPSCTGSCSNYVGVN